MEIHIPILHHQKYFYFHLRLFLCDKIARTVFEIKKYLIPSLETDCYNQSQLHLVKTILLL